jgi:hypothetical protein
MKKVLLISLLFFLVMAFPGIGYAQEQTNPQLLGSTKPFADDLKQAALDFVHENPPVEPAPRYYVISNVSMLGTGYYRISMIAYDLQSADEPFDLEMHDKVLWFGSLNVTQTGDYIEISYFNIGAQQGALKMASPSYAGGGATVWFPWQANKSVLFGMLGVHDEGYAGQRFVDLVSGDGMGSNAANSNVYASTNSTIAAICDDGQTIGVRMQTASSGDYYSYYHLLDNPSLVEGATFARGQLLGSLKYGTFTSLGCGAADQQPTNYHLHWGFQPNNGSFRAENCILSIGDNEWGCTQGDAVKVIKPRQWIYHVQGGSGGDPGTDPGDGGDPTEQSSPSFWDTALVGLYTIMEEALLSALPQKSLFDTGAVLARTAMLVIRMFFVLVRSTFDIRLAVNIFLLLGLTETALAIYAIYRMILKAIPGAG